MRSSVKTIKGRLDEGRAGALIDVSTTTHLFVCRGKTRAEAFARLRVEIREASGLEFTIVAAELDPSTGAGGTFEIALIKG